MVNTTQLINIPKDIYVGVKVYSAGSSPIKAGVSDKNSWVKAEIMGWITHDNLLLVESRNWGKANANVINYSELSSIEELIQYF
jgi:hypothetical protein